MKKLFLKFWNKIINKPQKQDDVSTLIRRLLDPEDELYDKEFAEGFKKDK